MQNPFVFYAHECSYFSAKVRPALHWKRVPHVEALTTASVLRDVIRARTGMRFIPVVRTPADEIWQDTSEILDNLERDFPEPALYPTTPIQRVLAYLWEVVCDEFLILPAMYYRWATEEGATKARGDFASGTGNRAASDRFAAEMADSLKALGVVPETYAGIAASTEELLDLLEAHFAELPFLLGDRPSLADCALMGPFYGHLYQDAVPGRLLRERSVLVTHWIQRMNHPQPDESGDFLADDALAPTMQPLLKWIGREAVPLLIDQLRDFEDWADTRPEKHREQPPRVVNFHETRVHGIAVHRMTGAYSLWMSARFFDALASLTESERNAVDSVLAGTGCEALAAYRARYRLVKRNYQLTFADPTS